MQNENATNINTRRLYCKLAFINSYEKRTNGIKNKCGTYNLVIMPPVLQIISVLEDGFLVPIF